MGVLRFFWFLRSDTPKHTTIADAEFLDQSGVVHFALFKVPQGLGVVRELPLIEGGSQFQHGGRLG
jgi:hypothetical protein